MLAEISPESNRSKTNQPIGIFDSGVGGLTVMKELIRVLPKEHLVYFGDTARVPYGNKSRQTIERYSIENTICLLLKKNIKLLVVACNTASAFALNKLRELFNIPIVGVIEPGAAKAITVTRNNRIAILGTKGTIQSGAYQKEIQRLANHAFIFPIACPLFVPLVEEQWITHSVTSLIVEEYLQPLKNFDVDTLLMGCTHYPLLHNLIQNAAGEHVQLVDSATSCANEVVSILQKKQLFSSMLQGKHQFFVSDDPEKFRLLGECLLGHSLDSVELLTPENLQYV